MGKRIILYVAILCAVVCASPVYSMPQYNIIDLSPVILFEPTDINNSGQVVGFTANGEGDQNGYLYSNGAITEIGAFQPSGINENGQVVGTARGPSERSWAFLYSDGVLTNIGNLGETAFDTGPASIACGINNSGQVVGSSRAMSGDMHAILYENGVMTDLGTLGQGESHAMSINGSGQVVGY